jgi:hypothetical protein
MIARAEFITEISGIAVVDENKALALLGLVLAVVFPIAGLPVSMIALRRVAALGGNPSPAKLGVQISATLLIAGALVAVVGFILSAVVPFLSA